MNMMHYVVLVYFACHFTICIDNKNTLLMYFCVPVFKMMDKLQPKYSVILIANGCYICCCGI